VAGSPFQTNGSASFDMAQVSGEATGKYLIGITKLTDDNAVVDKHIYVFSINQTTGALTALTPTATQQGAPNFMAVSPNGQFVYTFNLETAGSITNYEPMEGYSLSSAGALTPLGGSPYSTIPAQVGRFDQSGQYLFAVVGQVNTNTYGTFPLSIDTSTGDVSSTLPFAGVPGLNYAVTDEP